MFGSLVPARPALVERERFVFGSLDGHQGLADGMQNTPPTPAPKKRILIPFLAGLARVGASIRAA